MNAQDVVLGKSWVPTVLGYVIAIAEYLQGVGPNAPQSWGDWGNLALGVAIAAFGRSVKQANVTNSPAPVQPQAVTNKDLPAVPNPTL